MTEHGNYKLALQEAAADCCQEFLQRRYKTTGSYIQVIPWVDDDSKHVNDIYTTLVLQTNERLKSYEDIFLQTKEGIPIKRAILSGLAGRGKSTLVDKMAYDWAVYAVHVLQKYKLVFLLKMNALEQSSGLIDAIFDQLLDEDTCIDRHALGSFITNNPEKVLILVDGFDEIKPTSLNAASFGSILKILNRKIGREYFVVVSTRPSHYDRLVEKQLIQKPFTHVRVEGFDAENVEKYVERFYSEEQIKGEGLLQRIKSSNVLSDLAKSPMLLLLMCVLWREDACLPDTMSRLYNEALRYIFKRKTDLSQKEISNIAIEIGEVGLRGLLDQNQWLTFQETEFKKSFLDMAVQAGILTKQNVVNGLDIHNSIQFIHKTFQEFCAAKYLQSLSEDELKRTLDDILSSSSKDPREFEYLLRFCSGDNETCTNTILQVLLDRLPSDQRVRKLALDCYFESRSKNLPQVEFIESIITEEMSFEEWDIDYLNSFTWFLKNVTDQTKHGENIYLSKVKIVGIDMCHLQMRFCEGLAKSMTAMTNLSALTVSKCSLTVSSLKCIVSSLSNTTKLTKLDLSENVLMHDTCKGSAVLWASYVQIIKNLQKLDLSYCSLTADDIAVSLSNMPSLVELILSNNDALGGCAALWSHHLQHMKRLQKLDLSGCSLRGDDIKHIAGSLSELPNLFDLKLKENDVLAMGCSDAALSHIRQMKHLKKLDLGSCSLTGEDMKHIAVSPCDLPNLVELKLAKNKALGGCAVSWSPHIQHLNQLQKLDMGGCSLTDEDMNSLCDLQSLVEIQLIGNTSLGGCAASWAHSLQHMRQLSILGLRYCSFTGEDMKYIASSLCGLPNLVVLVLNGNKALGGSAASWSHHLRHMKHLKELELINCALIGEDMKYIAGSLCDLPNLGKLRLQANESLGGSVATWSHHLRQMKHLQKFDLGVCSVTGEDMIHIAESLSACYLPNLIEFKLSSNKTLSGSAALWSRKLLCMTQLKILNLGNCSLMGEDMIYIADALSNLPNLVELVLYGNKALSGSAALWCHHLKQIKKLDLSGCSLTGEDMKSLTVSCSSFYYSTSTFSYVI